MFGWITEATSWGYHARLLSGAEEDSPAVDASVVPAEEPGALSLATAQTRLLVPSRSVLDHCYPGPGAQSFGSDGGECS